MDSNADMAYEFNVYNEFCTFGWFDGRQCII